MRIGAINVDTAPLVAYVGNPTAGWAQQALPGALAQVLGAGAPDGPPLQVRIDTLYLGGGGPADPDRMRGVATLGRQDDKRAGSVDVFLKPYRSGADGAGSAGPRAVARAGFRIPVEEEAQGLTVPDEPCSNM